MIRTGSTVLLSLASATRDEGQFPEPDEFRIDRVSTRPILSFGQGLH